MCGNDFIQNSKFTIKNKLRQSYMAQLEENTNRYTA